MDPNAYFLVLVDASKAADVQKRELSYWLSLIATRVEQAHAVYKPAVTVLATHADAKSFDCSPLQRKLTQLRQQLYDVLVVDENVLPINAQRPNKALVLESTRRESRECWTIKFHHWWWKWAGGSALRNEVPLCLARISLIRAVAERTFIPLPGRLFVALTPRCLLRYVSSTEQALVFFSADSSLYLSASAS